MEQFIFYYRSKLNDKCIEWFRHMSTRLCFKELSEMLLFLTKNLDESTQVLDEIVKEPGFSCRCITSITQWQGVPLNNIRKLLEKTEISVVINKLKPDMNDEFINIFLLPKIKKLYGTHLISMCCLNGTIDKLSLLTDYEPSTQSINTLFEICEGEPENYDPKKVYPLIHRNQQCPRLVNRFRILFKL